MNNEPTRNLSMKKMTCALTLSFGLLLTPVTVKAQDAAPPAPLAPEVTPVPPAPPAPAISNIFVGDSSFVSVASQPDSLKAKVAIDANNASFKDVIRQIADQVKIPVEFADDVPADLKVTMTLKNVAASDALRLLTREAGVSWGYSKTSKDGKKTEAIRISKKRQSVVAYSGRPETVFRFPSADTPEGAMKAAQDAMKNKQYEEVIRGALAASREALRASSAASRDAFSAYSTASSRTPYFGAFSAAALPDKRVKLDSRNARLRDVLKDVLKQADLSYALDNDVPEDVKRSFTFENVPISMALDLITRSVDIGWRAEKQKDGKVLVVIGKKYARGNGVSRASLIPNDVAPIVASAFDEAMEGINQASEEMEIPEIPDAPETENAEDILSESPDEAAAK